LRIPENKRERTLAILDYVLSKPGQELSRLALSVVFGVLQSLVDATPSSLGQTFLQESYKVLYLAKDPLNDHLEFPDYNVPEDPRAIFFTKVKLSRQSWDDLIWWQRALAGNVLFRPIRNDKAAMLSPTWGDGSGTGTGGTIQVGTSPTIQWQGQWLPCVLSNSSNWKEAHTCLLTVQQLWRTHSLSLLATTVFYFTDNTTTYYALRKGSSRIPALHALVREIKLICLQMGCLLEPVHVPGKVMINQGTDGLSRGVWVSPFHAGVSPTAVTAAVFAPVPIVNGLSDWVQSLLPRPTLYEVPWSTEFAVLIPRVLQGYWENLSRHIQPTRIRLGQDCQHRRITLAPGSSRLFAQAVTHQPLPSEPTGSVLFIIKVSRSRRLDFGPVRASLATITIVSVSAPFSNSFATQEGFVFFVRST
jgi:hypothetical protein